MPDGLLVLWDIDHTLVDTRGVGRELWAEAFDQVTGVTMREQVRVDGLTEPVIFRETARMHELPDSVELFAEFARALGAAHVRHAADLRERGCALPGVPSLLAAVARRGIRQTVVTGNVREAAVIKLAAFGLDAYVDLDAAAFGEDAEERPELVRIALKRAGVRPAQAVLLGDTPADVRGGVANGVRSIGVATGRTGADQLREAGAAAVLGDLSDTEAALRVITCGAGRNPDVGGVSPPTSK
ncbi:HAD family hydrolase [Streptomyces sp. HSW2009]|uniref:HAD family hydrolase n=1 Tax=Streptomyces sp. HSW2009 TaxID=3142890 RepID=UPI0032F01BC7